MAALSQEFGWTEHAIEGLIANVEYLRTLTESAAPRKYLQDECSGEVWAFETAFDQGEWVAIRQVQGPSAGPLRRYSWEWREGYYGKSYEGLTDQPFDGSEDGMVEMTRGAFWALWERAAP